jgi:hypothetical protein
MLDALRLVAALLLIFFVPGILLVQGLFPRERELDLELDWLYRFALGIGLSIVITILVGFSLNSLGENPQTGMGYVTTAPITACLSILSAIFFVFAWYRGGMRQLGRLHPSLIRFPAPDIREDDIPHITDPRQRLEHHRLMDFRFALIREITKCERMIEVHSGEQKSYYEARRKKKLEGLADVERKIEDIEKGLPAAKETPEGAEDDDDEDEAVDDD